MAICVSNRSFILHAHTNVVFGCVGALAIIEYLHYVDKDLSGGGCVKDKSNLEVLMDAQRSFLM